MTGGIGGIDGGLPRGKDPNFVPLSIFTDKENIAQQRGVPKTKQTLQERSWEKIKNALPPGPKEANQLKPRARSRMTARADSALCPRPTLNANPKNSPLSKRKEARTVSGLGLGTLATVSPDTNTTSTVLNSRSSALRNHSIRTDTTQDSSRLSAHILPNTVSSAASKVDSARSTRTDSNRSDSVTYGEMPEIDDGTSEDETVDISDNESVASIDSAELDAIDNETPTTNPQTTTATPTINPAITAAANAPTATAAVNPATTAADEAKMKAAVRNNHLYTGGTKLQIDSQGLPQDGKGYKSVIHYLLAVKARQLALDTPSLKDRFEAAEKVILDAPTVQDALEWADIKLGIPNRPLKFGEKPPHRYDKFFEGQIMEDALKLALQSKFIDRNTGKPTEEGRLLLSTGDKSIISDDDSGSTKWQNSYTEHFVDKKGNVIKDKKGIPITKTFEGNNLMGQELEKIRAQLRNVPATSPHLPGSPPPATGTSSEYQNLPSQAQLDEMREAAEAQEETPPATSHYQSLPIDPETKRRHELAAEQAAIQQNPVRSTATRKTNVIPEMMYPVMPVHKHIDLTTGRLKDIYNLHYDRALRDGVLTPLEKGKQIATSYTKKKVVEFYREQETPDTKELGNFHPAPIKLNFHGEELVFQNAEAAFQASKVMHMFGDDPKAGEVIEQLKNTTRGDEAFAIMSEFNAKLADDETRGRLWGTINQQVMYQILMAKFSQNPELREKLLSTGNKPLIENTGGFGKQTTWGVNTSGEKAGKGQNQLGRILEVVRDSLRS